VKALLKPNVIALAPDAPEEIDTLAQWCADHDTFVFALSENSSRGGALITLGPRAEACREPINVVSSAPSPICLIANFAATPFELDGMRYACVEAFWQSLRFPLSERARIAAMPGPQAKQASQAQPYGSHVIYNEKEIPVGTWEHWQLMRRACCAKFEQNEDARSALLATGERPIVHRVRRDSRTIPGVIMAEIWMSLRAHFRSAASAASSQ
jgi:predicted NAD-dependent protein-ADP-ribosyltransferase YbiA (DUF1768 family)